MTGLRRTVNACLQAPWMRPFSSALSRRYRGSSTSLLYHRIVAGDTQSSASRSSSFNPNLLLQVSERSFELQMQELAEKHRAISLQQAVRELKSGIAETEAPSVTITFDDGYLDNLQNALPILERHGIPATIFVTTGLVDRTASLWWEELEVLLQQFEPLRFSWGGRLWYLPLHSNAAKKSAFAQLIEHFKLSSPEAQRELMETLRAASSSPSSPGDTHQREILSWEQVRELDRHPLISISAHSVNHPQLSALDEALVVYEMKQSRLRLEQQLGHAVDCFAYPFGGAQEASTREFRLCEAEGFESALTTSGGQWHPRHRNQLFALPRIMIEYCDTLDDFRFKLSGLASMLRLRGRLRSWTRHREPA